MLVAGLAMAMLAAEMQVDAEGYSPATSAYSFTIDLPAGASLIHREILDFDLYKVVVEGRPILALYEGGAANVSSFVQDRTLPGRQDRATNGQASEYFWNLQCDGWSNEVHAWLTPTETAEDAERGRQVAETLTLKPCIHPKDN